MPKIVNAAFKAKAIKMASSCLKAKVWSQGVSRPRCVPEDYIAAISLVYCTFTIVYSTQLPNTVNHSTSNLPYPILIFNYVNYAFVSMDMVRQ